MPCVSCVAQMFLGVSCGGVEFLFVFLFGEGKVT